MSDDETASPPGPDASASASASPAAGPAGAPPLGQRPTEPTPGRESLLDPKGEQRAVAEGDGKDTCPDCGLPFGEHPDFHMHDGGGGQPGWAEVDLGDAGMDADDLPGQRIDEELGGDPGEG